MSEPSETLSVLIVEDDHDLSDSYVSVIQAFLNRPVVVSYGVADLMALGPSALKCSVALVDIDLGVGLPSGLDAYQWLITQRFQGRVCFITGHASAHPLVTQAVNLKIARVLSKPIGIHELIQEILGNF